ncbi:hypothetical protein ACFO4N_00300 [Camelliibacillus cellulosilyticus]|uniref:Uncharacterized protein n=1 Tax=Camelliibacillus cellulosilyticus TaxID=2174486 RepID=A0ABV9GJ73_9BACL
MQVFALFEHSNSVEIAISRLQEKGIESRDIFAVPIKTPDRGMRLFDSIHDSDGISLIDLGFVLCTALGVIGASIGFKLALGPIVWGLIGAVSGFLIGVIIEFILTKTKRNYKLTERKILPVIILIVNCSEEIAGWVETVLIENKAIGVNTPQKHNPNALKSGYNSKSE